MCWHTACANWLLKYDNKTIMQKQLERIDREVKGFKGEMPGNKKSKCYDFLIISKKNLETLVAGKVKDRKKVEYPDTLPNVLSAHILYSIPYSAKMGK